MTIHTFLNMVVDWVSGDSEYKTRLELGQSSGTLTDIRFMVPAWIEKVQTIWFGENGSESAYTGSDGAKITTYLSAGNVTDLVFFDPENTGGKTLSELASVAGLWETSGTRTSLIASQPIDLANELNMAGQIIDNASQLHANTAAGMSIYDSTGAWKGTMGTSTYAFQCTNAGMDMNNKHIDGVNDIKGTQAAATTLDLYGSNAAGSALVNFMGWDSATETVKVNKPLAMGANKITGLAAGTVNGDALRYEQAIGVYLPLAGGTMDSEAGINLNQGLLTNVGGLSLYNSSDYIDMNGGWIKELSNIVANSSPGLYIYDYLQNLSISLGTSNYAAECSDPINMVTHKIIGLGNPTSDQDAATKSYTDNLPGTDSTTFVLDQDNAGAEANMALRFDRGSTATYAQLLWDAATDRFSFYAVGNTTLADLRVDQIYTTGGIGLDGTSGKITIKENDSTGDMEFCVQSGDAFVFKTVA